MIKVFCDQCGEEIAGLTTASDRIRRKYKRITIEVVVAIDGVWNAGAACTDCILEAIGDGTQEPRS